MKVLLIWSNVTDGDVSLFILEGDNAEMALKCHGVTLGVDYLEEDHPIFDLNDILSDLDGLDGNSPITLEGEHNIVICGYAY